MNHRIIPGAATAVAATTALALAPALSTAAPSRGAVRSVAATDRTASRFCPSVTIDGIRIVHLQRKAVGCRTAARLAARTVRTADGYLKTKEYYCRWRSGASGRIHVGGETYDEGFISRPSDPSAASVVTFYARKVAR